MKKNKKKIKLSNLSKLEMKKVVGGTAIITEIGKGTADNVNNCLNTEDHTDGTRC